MTDGRTLRPHEALGSAWPFNWKLTEARPGHWFALLCLFHLVVWTAAPALMYHSLPRDTVETIAWGHLWQFGYDKHPFLAPWLAAAVTSVFGVKAWAVYLLDQAAVLVCFWAVWRLAGEMLDPWRALVAVALLEGIHYYNLSSFTFNPNVAMLPAWALASLAFHRALRAPSLRRWSLAGLLFGLAMLAKYESAILGLVMLATALLTAEGRASLRTRGPYLGIAVALLVMLPNLIWLVRHDFTPIHYALGNMNLADETTPAAGATGLYPPLLFVLEQLAALLPAVLLYLPLAGKPRKDSRVTAFDRRFSLLMAGGPLALTVLIATLTDANLIARWGFPFLSLAGVALVILFPPRLSTPRLKRFATAYLGLTALMVAGLAWTIFVRPFDTGRPPYSIDFPGPDLADRVTRDWHAQQSGRLPYVIGDRWTIAAVAATSPDLPVPYFNAQPKESPWLAEADLRRAGAMVVVRLKNANNDNWLTDQIRSRFPVVDAHVVELEEASEAALPPDRFWIATLPPAAEEAHLQAKPGARRPG